MRKANPEFQSVTLKGSFRVVSVLVKDKNDLGEMGGVVLIQGVNKKRGGTAPIGFSGI